ncbi:glycosyltransferase [Bradyrhizobium sp. B117]|uniref:glycosyltransferase n=1 Tax=Bradyrhizobium sp. B117 TaxID=3140246 RepID=UPI00318363CC
MTTISIAMATYNGERFIREQLASLKSQTVLPSELIVTDDGSTDRTLDLISEFAATAPFPVRVWKNDEKFGYKANFMKCASLCSGDLIAFADQDDVWLPGKLEAQRKIFEDPAVLLSSHDVMLLSEDGSELGDRWQMLPRAGSYTFDQMRPSALSLGFTQMFRKELLQFSDHWRNPSVDAKTLMAHDEYYFLIACVIGCVFYESNVYAHYRQHSSNVTGRKKKESMIKALSNRINLGREEYERYVRYSLERVRVLSSLQADPKVTEQQRKKIDTAAQSYARFSSLHALRSKLYGGQHVGDRAAALLELCQSGGYRLRPNPWHLTLGGFAKDFLAVFYR